MGAYALTLFKLGGQKPRWRAYDLTLFPYDFTLLKLENRKKEGGGSYGLTLLKLGGRKNQGGL